VQHERVDVDALELGHELGRVRRAGADDRRSSSLDPRQRDAFDERLLAAKKTAITGAMNSSVAIIVRFHCTW
jgi:hypothetical protein